MLVLVFRYICYPVNHTKNNYIILSFLACWVYIFLLKNLKTKISRESFLNYWSERFPYIYTKLRRVCPCPNTWICKPAQRVFLGLVTSLLKVMCWALFKNCPWLDSYQVFGPTIHFKWNLQDLPQNILENGPRGQDRLPQYVNINVD